MLHHDPQHAKHAKPSDDEVKLLLKRAARRGPYRRVRFFVALVVLALVAGSFAWWAWPRPEPPQLVVVAFDQVALTDRPVTLRAATEPLDGSDVRWGGRDVFFEEVKGLVPGQSGQTKKVTTDSMGLTETAWQFGSTGTFIEMEVRYLDDRFKPAWFDRAHGRVFVWGPDARVLVVDVDPTLKKANDWAALASSLTAAAAKGWQVVYLGMGAERPLEYRKLREHARQLLKAEPGFAPEGPVLARKSFFQGATEAESRKAVLADLKRDFLGPIIYVTADPGIKLWTVGKDGDFTGPAVSVPDWPGLDNALPQ